MGAIITALITNYRNRIQSVYCLKQYISVFHQSYIGLSNVPSKLNLKAELSILEGNTEYNYENLSIVKITLTNIGNKDMEEFKFGITLGEDDKALHVETESKDRHHSIEIGSPISLLKPVKEVDLSLRPFNRRDTYSINLFVTSSGSKLIPDSVQISTFHPVKFTNKTPVETFASIALEVLRQFDSKIRGV